MVQELVKENKDNSDGWITDRIPDFFEEKEQGLLYLTVKRKNKKLITLGFYNRNQNCWMNYMNDPIPGEIIAWHTKPCIFEDGDRND